MEPGTAAGRIRSDRRQIRMLSLPHDPPHIRTRSRAAKARRLPATWSVVACTQPVRPFAESERGRGRERDRTYFHFSPVFAHGGNQRQLALVAREADQIVVCVVGHLLELFCQKSGLGLEESLPFRRRKHGKSNSCVQASSRHRNRGRVPRYRFEGTD